MFINADSYTTSEQTDSHYVVCVCVCVCVLGSSPPHRVTGSALSNSTCDWLTAPTEARHGRLIHPVSARLGSASCIATRTLSLGRKDARKREAVSAPQPSQRTASVWNLIKMLLQVVFNLTQQNIMNTTASELALFTDHQNQETHKKHVFYIS